MKKIRYNILKVALVLGLTTTPFVTTSCRQELDINIDPNNPADATVSGLMSGSQVGLGFILGGEASRIPGSIVQHYAGHRAQPYQYARYNFSSSDTEGAWRYLYDVLMDLREMESKAVSSGEEVYVGVSKLLQVYAFSTLTDLYGDIPFTEALKGRENITPKYDTQESIYPKLITMIEEGISSVKSGNGTISASADIVYNGDISKWVKFGNSLKLRLLNHQSKVNPNAAANFLATNPSLIDIYDDNAKVPFGTTRSNSNPIYQFDNESGRKDQAVASTIVDKMKSLNDPRVAVYFAPVKNGSLAGQYIGNAPGGNTDDSGESLYSRVGSAYASSNSPVMLISAAEVNFIKAEVYKRANNDASAKTAYENAIRQDFLALGLTNDASSYLANTGVAYNNTLERIMEQKWITMYQIPYESWVDWRRTGYPSLNLPANNRVSSIPRRLPYPTVEINVNGTNLSLGPGIPVPFVTYLEPVWWDRE